MSENLRLALIALVNIIGGLVYGYSIGMVPIFTSFHQTNADCSLYNSRKTCTNAKFSGCLWLNGTEPCSFSSGVLCSLFDDNTCTQYDEFCFFDFSDKICKHKVGWSATDQGLFAAAMIIGGAVGSLPAGLVVKRIGYRKTMALMAILTALGSALTSIGRAVNDNFPLIVISRIVIGITSSLACVACPLYVEVSSSPSTKKVFGVFFQVFCTFGIFLAAAIGLGLEPKGDFFINGGLSLEFRLHFVALFPLLFSLFFLFLAFTIPLRNNTINSGEETKLVNADTGDLNHEAPSVVKPLIAATALCIAQQFTGINAIMNYSGQITNTFGLQPLQGNILVMTWNFITTLVSIPLAQKVPPRTSFICATVLACVGCVISGIAAFPGIIHTPAVSNALGATGVALFVAVFELGMGCFFWVLASSIFPPHFRETGMGLTNMFQFVLNVAINFGFLVCVQALSGGESGNQNKGLAIMFFIFAGFGIATVPVLLAFLRQYDAPKRIN